MTRIAIVGSRDYPDLEQVRAYVRTLPRDTEIVSGGARGVDSVAVEEAKRLGMSVKVFPAQWQYEDENGNMIYDKTAGMKRNAQIVEYADKVVAFWHNKSRGTGDTIARARKAGKGVEVFENE